MAADNFHRHPGIGKRGLRPRKFTSHSGSGDHPSVKTTLGLPGALQYRSTSERGTIFVAICSLAGMVASKTLLIASRSADERTLLAPLPMSTIAEERKPAPGRSMLSSPLAPPTCTKRTGLASSALFAMAAMIALALAPQR